LISTRDLPYDYEGTLWCAEEETPCALPTQIYHLLHARKYFARMEGVDETQEVICDCPAGYITAVHTSGALLGKALVPVRSMFNNVSTMSMFHDPKSAIMYKLEQDLGGM